MKKEKILIAMSGGVDSSTAAAILLEAGHYCEGAFMITHDDAQKACDDAKSVADSLGVKLYILDWRERFQKVLDYFSNEYKHARTPNPCVFCNKNIKFAGLYEFAKSIGLEKVATGHYCQSLCENGKWGLYQAKIPDKDQSYALAMIDKSIVPNLMFPLGSQNKEKTREMASKLGLEVADKPDSQEICFIPDEDYVGKLESMCPELAKEGNVVDKEGKILGKHPGIHKFTIGQRRGLGIALGEPAYVVKLDPQTNTVELGPKDMLMHRKLQAKRVNWLSDEPNEPFEALIKIRYNHKGAPGKVFMQDDGDIIVEFDQPVSAITPGQVAVFYVDRPAGKEMLGGAWIEKAYE